MIVTTMLTDESGYAATIFEPPWIVPNAFNIRTDKFGGGVRWVPYTQIQTVEQVVELIEKLTVARDLLVADAVKKKADADVAAAIAAKNVKTPATAPAAQGRAHADRKS